ncbi:hypothetical protein SASPL_152299 [Salvia splendens]|uniref:Uncharacterized protein n=1 Tax=Salvia splendens TaxID=180675 RepID=A0A8X8W3C5_SALSN|nr:hypothetical protein SASPL_152299 [Salvia splendens]
MFTDDKCKREFKEMPQWQCVMWISSEPLGDAIAPNLRYPPEEHLFSCCDAVWEMMMEFTGSGSSAGSNAPTAAPRPRMNYFFLLINHTYHRVCVCMLFKKISGISAIVAQVPARWPKAALMAGDRRAASIKRRQRRLAVSKGEERRDDSLTVSSIARTPAVGSRHVRGEMRAPRNRFREAEGDGTEKITIHHHDAPISISEEEDELGENEKSIDLGRNQFHEFNLENRFEENLIHGGEFGWFTNFESRSNTILEIPIFMERGNMEKEMEMIFNLRGEDEEEDLFAGLGEPPECSTVFPHGMVQREAVLRWQRLATTG